MTKISVVMKGYPRLSETFIAQELLGLQEQGFDFDIWALRHPTDGKTHALHDAIKANCFYLPEYLHHDVGRVIKALGFWIYKPVFRSFWKLFWQDLKRDFTIDRLRRFGQALVLAREADFETALFYVHFLHTPASVTRYAAFLRGAKWSFAAHAKDIWITKDWEKREKIGSAEFGVNCTAYGVKHLKSLAEEPNKVRCIYHGLDLSRFPAPPTLRMGKRGDDPDNPIILASVGRLVEKKGYDLLLRALSDLPSDCHWRLVHIGGGTLDAQMKVEADNLRLSDRIEWRGAQDQKSVVALLREADLFVLPSRIAKDGDRDGLPNVLMEAASQLCPVVSTRVSAIPEFITDESYGYLVPPDDCEALTSALLSAIRVPEGRKMKAEKLHQRLVEHFTFQSGLVELGNLLSQASGQE